MKERRKKRICISLIWYFLEKMQQQKNRRPVQNADYHIISVPPENVRGSIIYHFRPRWRSFTLNLPPS
ncbi:MAG: hypothetical protein RL023_407 [Candidatus Parcubacteria bacterium]